MAEEVQKEGIIYIISVLVRVTLVFPFPAAEIRGVSPHASDWCDAASACRIRSTLVRKREVQAWREAAWLS